MHLSLQGPVLHLLPIHREHPARSERLEAKGTSCGIAQLRAAQAEVAPALHGQEQAQQRSPRDAAAHPAQVHQAVIKARVGDGHEVSPQVAGGDGQHEHKVPLQRHPTWGQWGAQGRKEVVWWASSRDGYRVTIRGGRQ